MTLEGRSSISGNMAARNGGGILNEGSTLTNAVAGDNVFDNTPNDLVL